MKCDYCGLMITDDSKVCIYCGKPVTDELIVVEGTEEED